MRPACYVFIHANNLNTLVLYFFLPVTSALTIDEEVDVNSYRMTFRKREDTGN
jgi:hypothetical protein